MRILSLGSINIDKVYKVKNFVQAGETIETTGYHEYPVGKGLNQSIAMAKAGLDVYHAGKIGNDGRWLKELLLSHDVNVDQIYESDYATGHAVIQVNEQGENSILLYEGSNHEITQEELTCIFADFCNEDVLVVQNELKVTTKAIDMAYNKGMSVVLNPSPINQALMQLEMSKVNYLIMNEIEALSLTSCSTVEGSIKKLLEANADLIILITLGAKGSLYADQKNRVVQKAVLSNVVDTTAAGDTFLGFFLASHLISGDIAASLVLASKASSITVSRQGAAVAIPSLSEVEALEDGDSLKQEDSISQTSID